MTRQMKTPKGLSKAEAFFFEQAGWSYHPNKETPKQGRINCAKAMAKAEAWLMEQPGHTIEWLEDDHPDRSGIDHDGPLFGCIVTLADGTNRSLCGIDLKDQSTTDPYTRVVVAELAAELMP